MSLVIGDSPERRYCILKAESKSRSETGFAPFHRKQRQTIGHSSEQDFLSDYNVSPRELIIEFGKHDNFTYNCFVKQDKVSLYLAKYNDAYYCKSMNYQNIILIE
jgi:hypothetical protein